MPDGTVFYGEIEYMNLQSGELLVGNYEELPEDSKKQYKLVRHGYGIQLYGRTDTQENLLIRYAGQWDRDRKHGDGQCVYPDGAEYKGHYKYEKFDGYGQFTWAKDADGKANVYAGYWKEGSMDGGGEFKHKSGQSWKGLFKNNLFNCENRFFLNPLNDGDLNEQYLRNAELHKLEEMKREKEEEERVRVFRVRSASALDRVLSQCKVDSRTPLILTSLE